MFSRLWRSSQIILCAISGGSLEKLTRAVTYWRASCFLRFRVFLRGVPGIFGGVPGFLGGVLGLPGVFRVFLGVFLVFLGCSGLFWGCSWFSWGCSWFSWGVLGFLGSVPGFLGVFRVFRLFRNVPWCSSVPVFLEVLHAEFCCLFIWKFQLGRPGWNFY